MCALVQACTEGQQQTMSADRREKTCENEERCCAKSIVIIVIISSEVIHISASSLFLSLSPPSPSFFLSLSLSLSLPFFLSFSLSFFLSFFLSFSLSLSLSLFPLAYAGFLLRANKEQYFIFFSFVLNAALSHAIL